MPDRFRLIPPSDLDTSVQDLAQLYATFARDRIDGVKTTRDFSDALSMHRLIDAIYEASTSETSVLFKEQS
jgi:predicted dehydrogenase